MSKEVFSNMQKLLKCKGITMQTRIQTLYCYVVPVLTYASECRTISPSMEKRIEAAELWFLRQMMGITWQSHTSNPEVLKKANTEKRLQSIIRKRQLEFFGHIMRKEGLEELFLTGKIEGSRDRGRQRTTFLKNIAKWTGISEVDLIRIAKDREKWTVMVADVLKRHGT